MRSEADRSASRSDWLLPARRVERLRFRRHWLALDADVSRRLRQTSSRRHKRLRQQFRRPFPTDAGSQRRFGWRALATGERNRGFGRWCDAKTASTKSSSDFRSTEVVETRGSKDLARPQTRLAVCSERCGLAKFPLGDSARKFRARTTALAAVSGDFPRAPVRCFCSFSGFAARPATETAVLGVGDERPASETAFRGVGDECPCLKRRIGRISSTPGD